MRSFWAKCLAGALTVGAWAPVSNAQQAGVANAQNNREMVEPDKEARQAAAEAIVAREEAASGRAFDRHFRAKAIAKLASRSLSDLASIESQKGKGLGILPQAFGSSDADLVYTPVAPCRIIDTRLSSGGGPITPGTNRNFFVAGSCGIPFGPATAAVINFVAVNPVGGGDLRITPFGTPIPFASIINYAPVPLLNIANGPAVKLCNPATTSCSADITMQADGNATDLVGDVQGYFSLLPTTAASGLTLTGTYAVAIVAAVAGDFMTTNITYPLSLASAPNTNFIPAGGSSTTNCPGSPTSPQAAAGNLCVYESVNGNSTFSGVFQTSTGNLGTDPFGSGLAFSSAAAGRTFSYGTWAVTAP